MAKRRDTFGDSPLGSGGRFAECVREMEKRPDVYDPAGLCASIGRKAYGKKRFAKMAKRGRERGNPQKWGTDLEMCEDAYKTAVAKIEARALRIRRGEELATELMRGWRAVSSAVELDDRQRDSARRIADTYQGIARGMAEAGGSAHPYMGQQSVADALGALRPTRPRGYHGTETETERRIRGAAARYLATTVPSNPLTDAEHMRTKKHTMELTDRMERVAMHEGNLGREDLADHWREMAQYVSGAGWAHMRASQGIPFPEAGYAASSGLEGAEWEVLEELRAQAGPDDNPCGAGGYGPAANPVKPDGRWHKTQFIDVGEEKGTAYGMRTAKGGATIVPYKPRTFMGSRFAAEIYEDYRSQKIPKGSRFIVIVKGEAKGSPLDPSAHKSLDDAKKAGESALRKLPMPGARSNPAELINAGILAGSAPIPSGIDSPPVSGGILAGSRPIPSGFRDPRLNVGLVDPPLTRRSKPDQPT